MIRVDHAEGSMALFDDIPGFEDILGGGNWMIGLAIGVGALVVITTGRPNSSAPGEDCVKGGVLAYRGAAGLVGGIGDILAEAAAQGEGEAATQAVEAAAEAT
jgi:hypothetical protein